MRGDHALVALCLRRLDLAINASILGFGANAGTVGRGDVTIRCICCWDIGRFVHILNLEPVEEPEDAIGLMKIIVHFATLVYVHGNSKKTELGAYQY